MNEVKKIKVYMAGIAAETVNKALDHEELHMLSIEAWTFS